jgi:N-acetylglucosamine-6-phosphate deacetylase
MSAEIVAGRLVLDDRVVAGRIIVEGDRIAAVETAVAGPGAASDGPFVVPGFVDVHVHGFGGCEAMGDTAALDGMARALLRRGVTSFLPTAVTAPLDELARFAAGVRAWIPCAPDDGAAPLGFHLEGPFLSTSMKGAQNGDFIRDPDGVDPVVLDPLLDGARLMTVAPERPGSLDLIRHLAARSVRTSLGHSAANADEARAGYDAGAASTTHLFNAMSGVNHHAPGLAAVALARDDAFVELIADGYHVDRTLWPLILRTKPAGRVILVSDAIHLAGTGRRRGTLGALDVVIEGDRCILASDGRLASSLIALDDAVRNLCRAGVELPVAVAAASRNPLAMLGIEDRGRIVAGLRADLVEMDGALAVRRVMRAGHWIDVAAA